MGWTGQSIAGKNYFGDSGVNFKACQFQGLGVSAAVGRQANIKVSSFGAT
jgi:hypothetical protein